MNITHVTRGIGVTINLGNYQSAREDVSMTAELNPDGSDTYHDVTIRLEAAIKSELDRILAGSEARLLSMRENYARR